VIYTATCCGPKDPSSNTALLKAADIEIQAKEILFIREVLNTYIAEYCDQPKDKIEADCDRDFFMTPEEAVDYGIIDEVVKTKTSHITKPEMPVL